jgi:hypothetical protein
VFYWQGELTQLNNLNAVETYFRFLNNNFKLYNCLNSGTIIRLRDQILRDRWGGTRTERVADIPAPLNTSSVPASSYLGELRTAVLLVY